MLLVCLASRAHGIPGKIYTDMTLSNTNVDTITSLITYDPGGTDLNAALVITDTTSYSPNQLFVNTGDLIVTHYSFAGGHNIPYMIRNGNGDIDIRNEGDILLHHGTNENALFSILVSTQGSFENSGDLTMQLTKDGMTTFAFGVGITCAGDSLINSGDLTMSVQAPVATVGQVLAIGHGITFTGSTAVNSGNVSLAVTGGEITGVSTDAYARATGISAEGTLTNTGNITVNAVAGKYRPNTSTPFTGANATAHGISASDNLVLDSRGLVNVSAQPAPGRTDGTHEAYQLYVSSGTTTVEGYGMELNTQAQFTATYDGAFKINSGAGLNFNDAVLYLHIGNTFDGQAEYTIPTLVEGAGFSDQFSSLGSLPPEYQATLVSGNGTGPQKLAFTYAPQGNMSLMSMEIMNTFDAREQSMIRSNVSQGVVRGLIPARRLELNAVDSPELLLSGAGPGVDSFSGMGLDQRHQVFAGPVILAAYDDSDNGYDAHTRGFLAGYTYQAGDAFFLGSHAGVTDIDIDFTGQGMELRSEDSLSYALGGHLVYLLDDQWLVTGLTSIFYGETDYRDLASNNLETASYHSITVLTDVSLGRLTQVGWATLIPEAGIAFAWNYREAFTTDNRVNPDVRHGTVDELEAYAKLGLECYARFEMGDGVSVLPGVGVGISRTLTDGDSEATMGVAQVTRSVAHHADRTAVDLGASLTLEQESISLQVGSTASFSRNSQNYLFWLELGVAF